MCICEKNNPSIYPKGLWRVDFIQCCTTGKWKFSPNPDKFLPLKIEWALTMWQVITEKLILIPFHGTYIYIYIVGLAQDCSNSIAKALSLALIHGYIICVCCKVNKYKIMLKSWRSNKSATTHKTNKKSIQSIVKQWQVSWRNYYQGPLSLTWFNFNPSMDK